MNIQELTEKIKKAREAYYNMESSVSDQEYDAMVDELKKLDPNNEQITSIGAAPTQHSVWTKVKHEIPMGSLDKVNSTEEFKIWANKTDIFHVTHKIDGSSMELVYKSGNFIKAISRGDGITGDDVTTNIIQIPSIPKKLTDKEDVIIRGEVVMFKNVFRDKYANQYANPRNTAAGKVRDKKGGGKDCENLEFLAYWMNGKSRPQTMLFMFKYLESLGFKTPNCSAGHIDHIVNEYQHIKENRDEIPYEIDGMVISVNDIQKLENLGDTNMRPKGMVAWKFDPAMGIATALDVVWQNGLSGRICPVLKTTPVNIGGVTITSISLHNLAMFNELKLHKGCRVLVERRNDVIPYVKCRLDD